MMVNLPYFMVGFSSFSLANITDDKNMAIPAQIVAAVMDSPKAAHPQKALKKTPTYWRN